MGKIMLEQYFDVAWLYLWKIDIGRSYLDIGLANWLKSLVLVAKYPYGVFLQTNASLGELRHQGFIAFLVVNWVCYSSVTDEGCCAWTAGLNSLGKHVPKCDRENRGGGVRSN